jgi:hypothetical protein
VNRERSLHFEVLFEERFDSQDAADELADLLLSMPGFVSPLTVYWEDGKRRIGLKARDIERISSSIRFARTGADGISYGEIEIRAQRIPDFHVFVQWNHPRRIGLNAVFGYVPMNSETHGDNAVTYFSTWVLSAAERRLGLVYGNIETLAEWSAKMTKKEPPSGVDLRQWLDKPQISPKAPPKAITDIVWTNLFGRPYVELIGRDKLLSAPANKLNELPSGAIMLQVSESPSDFGTGRYKERCEDVKKHLGQEYFFDWENPNRDYPMPKLNVEYAKPKEYTEEELEQLMERAGIPKPADASNPEDKEWLNGLRDWVDHNDDYAKRFTELVRDKRGSLDFSIDSLKVLDKYILKRRKRDREADADFVLMASAYLAQVLARNSPSGGRAKIRVDLGKNHAVVELPNGLVAVPMARIANLWNLGREEETYLYAKTLLGR